LRIIYQYFNLEEFYYITVTFCLAVTIFQRLSEVLSARQSSILGIQPVTQVIRGIQTSPRQLTSLHAIFFQMCLDSLALKVALPFLVDDIDDFSKEVRFIFHLKIRQAFVVFEYYVQAYGVCQFQMKGADGKPLLLYFYYGGMIYAALRKYKEALFFFEACLRVPTVALSYVMLEAYKKFLLLSLYYYGEISQPPKCAIQTVNR